MARKKKNEDEMPELISDGKKYNYATALNILKVKNSGSKFYIQKKYGQKHATIAEWEQILMQEGVL